MSSHNDREFENFFTSLFNGIGKGVTGFFKSIFWGFKALRKKKSNYVFLGIWIIVGWALFRFRGRFWTLIPKKDYLESVKYIFYLMPGIPLIYLYFKGEQYNKKIVDYTDRFSDLNFYRGTRIINDAFTGERLERKNFPVFLDQEQKGKKVIYTFKTNIPIHTWKDKYADLEAAFDCNIIKIENDKKSKQIIRLHTIPTDQGLQDYIPWTDDCIRENDFEFCVGTAMLEDVVFDFNKSPHALVAGVPGSGKSVLLRCILWQCIKKGAKIFMVDFKGGVEFGLEYEQFGEVIMDRQRAAKVLKELSRENEERLKVLRECRVKNIAEYNKKYPRKKLCRIVVFCDEVAEMLDKKGVRKADKGIYEEIEKELSTLARLGRAAGINLVLATQRPDANVIPGQIKNMLEIRISGRMVDEQVSEMVLGNTKATLIDDTKGRFMYNIGSDTYEFQAYWFEDKVIKPGKYTVGRMLTSNDQEHAPDAAGDSGEEEQETLDSNIELQEKQKDKKIDRTWIFKQTRQLEPEPEEEEPQPQQEEVPRNIKHFFNGGEVEPEAKQQQEQPETPEIKKELESSLERKETKVIVNGVEYEGF